MTNNNTGTDLALSSIEDVIEDARQGKLFILVDDEDRENEGDLCIIGEYADAKADRPHSLDPHHQPE